MMKVEELPADSTETVHSLHTLPIDVLEIISSRLTIKQRVVLASCCRALWAREDVTSSTALWGSLDTQQLFGQRRQADSEFWQLSLSAWLSKQQSSIHSLGLSLAVPHPAALLAGLAGSSCLRSLELHSCAAAVKELAISATWEPLRALTGLTRLVLWNTRLQRLPAPVSALTSLQHFEVSNHGRLMAGPAAWLPLQQLAGLTHLALNSCGLQRLPSQLTALGGRLSVLQLSFNGPFARDGFLPLQQLTAVSRLDLSYCNLTALPPQLSALGASLAELDLTKNQQLGARGDASAAFAPLVHCSALTRLVLRKCGLREVPPQLPCLIALAHLSLRSGAPLLQPLERAVTVTKLDLRECGLHAVPPVLTCLTALADLALGLNFYLGIDGDEDSCEPLRQLTTLRRLDMSGCGLARLPGQLAALTCLESLEASTNKALGRQAVAGAFQPLLHLTRLSRLILASCGLEHCLPWELAALRRLQDVTLSFNDLGDEGSLEPLRGAPALSQLRLSSCGLVAVPQLLGTLPALASLVLFDNAGLGEGGEGAWGPLAQLSTSLTRLNAASCGMASLPGSITALCGCRDLDLHGNPLFQSTLEPLRQLSGLTRVELTDCGIEEECLPAGYAALVCSGVNLIR